MKHFILACIVAGVLAGCNAGTLTVTKRDGTQKFYRVLECDMKPTGEVGYTDLAGKRHDLDPDFAEALYENKFTTGHFEAVSGCCGQ